MTWRELKEFSNNINSAFLDKEVILWHDKIAVTIIKAELVKEDQYTKTTDAEKNIIPESKILYTDKISSEYEKIYNSGEPIIRTTF